MAVSVIGVLSDVLPLPLPSSRKTAWSFLLGRSHRLLNWTTFNLVGVFSFLLL